MPGGRPPTLDSHLTPAPCVCSEFLGGRWLTTAATCPEDVTAAATVLASRREEHAAARREVVNTDWEYLMALEDPDEVDGVGREAPADQCLHRHRDFFGTHEPAVTHHGAGHVQEHDRAATGHAFVKMEFEIFFGELNATRQLGVTSCLWIARILLTGNRRLVTGNARSRQRVVHGRVQVQF